MPGSPTDPRWKIHLGDLSVGSSSPIHPLGTSACFEESPAARGFHRVKPPITSISAGTFSSWSGPTGRENAKTNSLTKLQLEKWNLQDQVKMLEAQVRSRDALIQENQQLRDDLLETSTERDSFKQKYTELAHKLSVFLKKEKAERNQVDSEITKTKKECNSIEIDRERILEEKNRICEELEAVKAENTHLKAFMSQSVDRESLERQKQDILQENSQLRLMLEDSIPKCLYHRLEQQLTETVASASVHGASMRELQLDNQRLLTRLNTLEHEEAESCSKIQSLQKELKQSQEALLSARKYLIGQEEEAKKIRESLEDKSAVALRTLQEEMKAMEVRCQIAEESLEAFRPGTNMRHKLEELAKQVLHLRESLGSMKVEFLNLKRSIANAVFRDVEKIIAFHQRNIKLVAHDINCIMAESGVFESEGTPHVGLSETLDGMRSLIVRLSRDWRNARSTAEQLMGEVASLKQSVSEKDSIIDGLALRLSNFDRAKRAERASLSRLRNSIESAERKLNASRLHD